MKSLKPMKKVVALLGFIMLLSCTNKENKLKEIINSEFSDIKIIETIEIQEEYEYSFRSPDDKGISHKGVVEYIDKNNALKDACLVFFAKKYNWHNPRGC